MQEVRSAKYGWFKPYIGPTCDQQGLSPPPRYLAPPEGLAILVLQNLSILSLSTKPYCKET